MGTFCSGLPLQSSFPSGAGGLQRIWRRLQRRAEGADWRASAAVASGPGLRGAVCPGYICSGLSLQSSFHFVLGALASANGVQQSASGGGEPIVRLQPGCSGWRGVGSGAVCPGYICSGLPLQSSFPSGTDGVRGSGGIWASADCGVRSGSVRSGLSWVHLFWTLPPKFLSLRSGRAASAESGGSRLEGFSGCGVGSWSARSGLSWVHLF